jgi:endonuclease YncB( thermonuclease family)
MKSFALALATCCLLIPTAAAKGKAADKWVKHSDVKFTNERQSDGDSFGMEIKTQDGNPTVHTYRIYGVDCPEFDAKDEVLADRIKQQAEYFGCKPKDIPKLGKEAADFTHKLLTKGKPLLITRGPKGEKAESSDGRPQRYFALVEVDGPDGKRRLLHELLLEAGLARSYGKPAAWPPELEDRHGEKEAGYKFRAELNRIEKKAKRDRLGAWEKAD